MSISNTLIIISIFFTILSFKNPDILNYWMNHHYILKNDYINVFMQFFVYSFIHWSIIHIIFNSIFLYIFWNPIEKHLWANKYLLFFLLNIFIIWVSLLYFTPIWANTIWISWFALAVLSYYTLLLYSKNDSDYKWWITAIIINIWVWFMPWISFIWHLVWALVWVIFFIITNKNKN